MILALVIGPLLRHKYFLWTWKLFTIYWPCCCVCVDIAKHNRTNNNDSQPLEASTKGLKKNSKQIVFPHTYLMHTQQIF